MSIQETTHAVTQEAIKVAPPVAVSTGLLFGYPISNYVLVLTGIYTLLMIFVIIRDKFWKHSHRHKGDNKKDS